MFSLCRHHRVPSLISKFRTTSITPGETKPPPSTLMKRPAVLYHYPCPDGAFAALAAHLYFSSIHITPLYFPNAVYSPIRVEDLPLNEIDHVYLLDFVGPSGFVHQLHSKVDCVVVLDHHKTARELLGGGTYVSENLIKVIDMDRSGATIAYDYFKEKLINGDNNKAADVDALKIGEFDNVRRLFEYIEDRDLWRWKLPDSKAFSSGLDDRNIEYDVNLNPSLFQQLLALDLKSLIEQGKISLSHKQKRIDEVLEKSFEIALGAGTFGCCLAVNADSLSELRSELGNQLAVRSRNMKLRGIGAVVYKVPELENDQMLKVSLRSIGDEDTTSISQAFGGGGHRNASSFMLNSTEFENWKVK
ncbi:uncharacterized protein LOC107827818 isoform X2 [Nicotiana tabacum]|uniref:Uncharacterized protein LOC107827818 isoform X2 n=2 Tax=Nicotiana TaxID=4085 RepID=A0A1S4DAN7_TOBAC|nr:PREDICTED: uncharacterized protein LOC107827818 isoform X2 [Nicotiana tabacum]